MNALRYGLIILNGLLLPGLAFAQPDLGLEYLDPLGLPVAEAVDPRVMLVDLVRYALTFVAIIAVAIIIFGGFRLMVSMGNEENITKARGTIISGVIGLILVLSSFAIINLIINTTSNALTVG